MVLEKVFFTEYMWKENYTFWVVLVIAYFCFRVPIRIAFDSDESSVNVVLDNQVNAVVLISNIVLC